MTFDMSMPALPYEHARGLDAILTIVCRYASNTCEHSANQRHYPNEPVRLLISTRLALIAVLDYVQVKGRVGSRVKNPSIQDTVTEVDQIARRLRFAINDADTAQILVLILAVPGTQFREVGKLVFGPDGSRGEQVLRIVQTTPRPANDERSVPAANRSQQLPLPEEPGDWWKWLLLDLEIVRPTLLPDIPPLEVQRASELTEAAGAVVNDVLKTGLPSGTTEAHGEWIGKVSKALEDMLVEDDRVDTMADLAARALLQKLSGFVDELAPEDPDEETTH